MSFKNKVVSVMTEKIVFPGRSLCRCSDGVALFTDGLLPGETADVFVIKDKKTFREGFLKNITSRASERIVPLCPHFGFCGGCSFQNISYEAQIRYKREYLSELLAFTGVGISEVLTSTQVWHYRNKMEFSFFNNGNTMDLGLHCKGNFNKYIPIRSCSIANKDFMQIIEIIRKFAKDNKLMTYNNGMYRDFFRHLVLRKAEYNNQFLVNLVTSTIESGITFLEPLIRKLSEFVQSVYWTSKREESNVVLSDKITLIYGKSFIIEKLHINGEDYFFNISPFSFFQTNSRVAEILCDEVLRLLKPLNDDVLLDLYCGIGMIGISIARSVKKVVGVEQIKQAIDNAMENALVNAVSNLKFYVSDVQSWIKQNQSYFSAIILDPPRSGLTKGIIKFLISSKAKKIIYISCNPSILARDLMIITKNTEYKIKKITPVDMFPQTYHIETVVLLEL